MIRRFAANEVRSLFLDYFVRERGHVFWPSSSVIPRDDPTLLFTNAGMNQFKPIFQGTATDPSSGELARLRRAANSQKCIRAGGRHNDLADVGRDLYHHTFFEMLGNWSFGDYFKAEMCAWAWEFLTERLGLAADRLYVTYFGGEPSLGLAADAECREMWLALGVAPSRLLPFGARDNFWEVGERGPCGPCSEIHYDRREFGRYGQHATLVNAGDPSVVEIWNLVFMEYNRGDDGGLERLPQRHIDCGLGFERLVAVMQDKLSNYDTDLFTPIFTAIQERTGAPAYAGNVGRRADPKGVDTAYRIVADHIRALTVALSDGAKPANTNSGYVVRQILRRAVHHASRRLGASPGDFASLVPTVVESLGDTFPELRSDPENVMRIINDEEDRFLKVLQRGQKVFSKSVSNLQSNIVTSELAYFLHDTHGVPVDVTQMMAEERGLRVDLTCFEELKRQASKLTQDAYAKSKM